MSTWDLFSMKNQLKKISHHKMPTVHQGKSTLLPPCPDDRCALRYLPASVRLCFLKTTTHHKAEI